jgi:hypothetical protein
MKSGDGLIQAGKAQKRDLSQAALVKGVSWREETARDRRAAA